LARTSALSAQEATTTRRAILNAALRVFARDGYDGASMPRIARLAEVAPPLLHYYFGSKENLWRETVGHSLDELKAEAAAVMAATRALAPLDRLRSLLNVHSRFAARQPDHFFMIAAEARSDSARFAWVQEHYTGALFGEVVALLTAARDAGAIRAVALDSLATMLMGAILVNFTVYPARADLADREGAADRFSDMLFEVLLRGVAVVPGP